MTAAFYAQSSVYYQQRLREVVTSLPALIDFATMRQYVSAAGRLHSLKGVLEVNQSALAASLEDYYAALANYEQVGDLESAAAAHNQIAENLQALGEPRDSWNHHGQALSLLPIVTSPLVRHQILWFAIQRCLHEGMPDVALHFENAFLENASNWANGNAIGATTSGYLQRSLVLSELGDFESARRDLDEARRRVADVRDPALAERWRTEILATAGELSQHDSRADAIGALTSAIGGLEKSGSLLRLSHLYLLRGRAHLARHDVSEAASDFDRGIASFEYQHDGISQERFRISHFDEAWELFTDMVRLQLVEKKRADVALAYVERARARTLLEAVTRTTKISPTLDLPDVQRRLPADAAILSFVTLSDTLVTWVITRQSVDVLWQPLDLHRLEATVDSLLASLRNQDGGAQIAQLSSLYDTLIEPTARARQGRRSLIVIPDGPLHRVPFAALVDRHTGRYLIEQGSVSIAPSISLLMDSSSRVNDSVRSTGPRVLIVGNPAINRRIYPGLPNLDGAEAEAMDVAGQHPGADLLIKQHATKAEFLRLLRQAEMVHFAGHAVANAEYPWLSRLLFAPEADPGSDTLFAHELAGEHLNDLQLVVLAACGTGKGAGVRGEGVLSLARPFIAAGARTVIASLWDVSDRDTQALFRAFYKGLQSGAVPAVALRDAQVAALHGQDPHGRSPTNWAAFTPITRSLMSVTTS